jgi:hypothetical protein
MKGIDVPLKNIYIYSPTLMDFIFSKKCMVYKLVMLGESERSVLFNGWQMVAAYQRRKG